MSLSQRCVLFHRRFPDVKISHSLLYRFYRSNKIRYKKIKRTKFDVDYSIPKYRDQLVDMKHKLEQAELEQRKIIYIDEAVFSFKTFKTNAWSSAYSNLKIDNSKIRLAA